MKAEIAYIDDNLLNLDSIKTVLQSEFQVHTFNSAEKFLREFSGNFDTILIDIHMPNIDGFALFEKIIEHPLFNHCPILFISSDDSDFARIKSFNLGAVDFINRSISTEEFIARVKSKIQFFAKHRSVIEFTGLKLNLTLLKAYLDGVELPLTFIEFKILCLMLRTFPDIVTKEVMVPYVWRAEQVLDATMYTHVSNLNSKIAAWDYEIKGMRNRGFQLLKKEE